MLIQRRTMTAGAVALLAAGARSAHADDVLAILEARSGGRLGVAALDTGNGRQVGYRATERFPLCSTFKLLLAGNVLARVDAGQERLDRVVRFTREQLVANSPATSPQAGGPGMTIAALCEAAVTLSDNTAANLLLSTLGGPSGLTRFVRGLGDEVTRLDRTEPTLNEAVPGDPRDTTTPADMLRDVQGLVLGTALSPAGRGQLVTWLRANRTGDKRLRAELPPGWQVGDKTGTGERGTANDAGVLWAAGRAGTDPGHGLPDRHSGTDARGARCDVGGGGSGGGCRIGRVKRSGRPDVRPQPGRGRLRLAMRDFVQAMRTGSGLRTGETVRVHLHEGFRAGSRGWAADRSVGWTRPAWPTLLSTRQPPWLADVNSKSRMEGC